MRLRREARPRGCFYDTLWSPLLVFVLSCQPQKHEATVNACLYYGALLLLVCMWLTGFV